MTTILVLILSSFAAVAAALTRFAIKEYTVFKKLKIPSLIFKHGFYTIFIIWLCHLSANYVYSSMLPLIQTDKIEQVNKYVTLVTDKWFVYYLTGWWLFIWFCTVAIDELAKNINKIRNDEQAKITGISNK